MIWNNNKITGQFIIVKKGKRKMKKPKFIQDDLTIEYKKRLKEFQKVVNPNKFTESEIERIKQNILSKRGN